MTTKSKYHVVHLLPAGAITTACDRPVFGLMQITADIAAVTCLRCRQRRRPVVMESVGGGKYIFVEGVPR